MNTEIVKSEPMELASVQDEPQSILAVIARAAADPRVDVAKMQALLDMNERIERRQAEIEFNAAMARIMPKMPRIQKNGTIFDKHGKLRSRYAKYEDIDREVRPLLAEEGLSVSFTAEEARPGYLKVTGTVRHKMGFSQQSTFTVPTENPQIPGAQGVGSADSFAKRYILINTFNIVCEGVDNDAQGDPQAIGAEQVLTIETLLQDTKADRAKFYAWAGVSKIEDILEKNYQNVLKALQAKGRQ